MIPQYIVDSIPKLKELAKNFTPVIKAKLLRIIFELALNALHNPSLLLTPSDIQNLKVHKRHYIQLIDKKTSLRQKQLLIKKKGHLFIPVLIRIVLLRIGRYVLS